VPATLEPLLVLQASPILANYAAVVPDDVPAYSPLVIANVRGHRPSPVTLSSLAKLTRAYVYYGLVPASLEAPFGVFRVATRTYRRGLGYNFGRPVPVHVSASATHAQVRPSYSEAAGTGLARRVVYF
jgi:hypothetical protein